jgi:hypothetical protein
MRLRGQCELWHEEESSGGDFPQREVHPILGVGEDSVGEESLEQAVRCRGVIPFSDTDQCENAALDRTYYLAVHAHVGAGDTLDEPDHVAVAERPKHSALTTRDRIASGLSA